MLCLDNIDWFFVSYDEPGADERFARIEAAAPCPIKRVHGIKGFDAAHRACAEQATTERFGTIDGDNLARPDLFTKRFEHVERDWVLSFSARNVVNGLVYGNGGVKVWPRGLVLHVPTHERASGRDATDFCWTYRYMQVNEIASDVFCNDSGYHAFRAGYREAVRLSLVEGEKLSTWDETLARIYPPNLSRLRVWTSVGADEVHGRHCIWGARAGLADLWQEPEPTLARINDYDAMAQYWDRLAYQGQDLRPYSPALWLKQALGFDCPLLADEHSRWFKQAYINPDRAGLMLPNMKPVEFPDV